LLDLQEYSSKSKAEEQVFQIEIKGGTFK